MILLPTVDNMIRKTVVLSSIVAIIISTLPLLHETFADHGQEISIKLNSAEVTPLSTNENAHRIRVLVNYSVNDLSISNQTINSVMKVYSVNGTLLKTSSSPNGFTINNTGIQRHATTLVNSTIQNVTAVVQFTDALKTVPVSNPVQIKLDLTQPTTAVTQEEEKKYEIAALP